MYLGIINYFSIQYFFFFNITYIFLAIGQVCASVIEYESSDLLKIKPKLSPQVEEIFKVISDSWLISKDVKASI